MVRKPIDVEELNKLVPDIPEGFEDWCKRNLPSIPIYYRRNGKITECMCGKCASEFTVEEKAVRHHSALCPDCGHRGWYE